MGKRSADGTWQDSCLAKLKPGEPFFVLRAQDVTSAGHVREWALQAHKLGVPVEKVREAIDTAIEMEAWPDRKVPD